MTFRSCRSTEAPVHAGRAPRRVPAAPPRRCARTLLLAALTVLAGLALAPAAAAHEGTDVEIAPVLDRVSPEMPGVALTVELTPLGPQFVLENPTPTEVTILSSVGDPLFRVGPQGVLGNIRSPEWYTAKTPNGAIVIPERAVERGAPVWLRVSEEPAWGWFDHRLHAVTLSPEQKAATQPMAAFATWTVPLTYGDALGSADGHVEYRPALGTFTPALSDTTPAPGVTLVALQGNPRPGIAISNTGSSEVVVLGDAGEPYLRITQAGTEANGASPTWIRSQNPAAQGSLAGDPAVPPQWVSVNVSSQYSFSLERAEPAPDLGALYRLAEPTVVREWSLVLLVDGRPTVVDGTTTMTPTAYRPSVLGSWLGGAAVLLVATALVATLWWVRRRRRAAANRPSARPAGKREKVSASGAGSR